MSLTTAAAKRYVQSLHTLGRQSFCDGRGAEGHQTRGLGESTEGVERGAEGMTSELVLLGSPEVTPSPATHDILRCLTTGECIR